MEPSSGLAGWLPGALYATQQLDLLGPLHPPTVVLAVPTLYFLGATRFALTAA